MTGVMLVRQKGPTSPGGTAMPRDPGLDAVRHRQGLVMMTSTCAEGNDPDTGIVVTDMIGIGQARARAGSVRRAAARARARAIGVPDRVWRGRAGEDM
jgi:hypothetical protein